VLRVITPVIQNCIAEKYQPSPAAVNHLLFDSHELLVALKILLDWSAAAT